MFLQKKSFSLLLAGFLLFSICGTVWAQECVDPVFELQTNPFGQITPEEDVLAPKAVDIDGDGDSDVMLASTDGNLYCVINSGDSSFETPVTIENLNLSKIYFSIGFADISGNTLPDMFISEHESKTLKYFENNSTSSANIQFQDKTDHVDNPFKDIEIESSNPTNFTLGFAMAFGDIDNDSDIDAVFGVKTALVSNRLILFKNNGGTYTKETADNPFECVVSGDLPAPDLRDIDGDEDLDLIVGTARVTKFYKNIGSKELGVFVPKEGGECLLDTDYSCEIANPETADVYFHPAFTDLNKDGAFELLIGYLGSSEFQYWSISKGIILGDINGVGGVDLSDAILGLKILADADLAGETINLDADINPGGTKQIGLEEVIYILREVANSGG